MTAICVGQTERHSCHKGPSHPQPKLGNVGHRCRGSVSPTQHHAALLFLEVCCSSCGKTTAGTSSNKYHLYHQQVQLVVGPNQHQPNWQSCRTPTCAATGPMQTAYLGPDEVYLAGPLEWQGSAVARTKTCQNGALPKPPTGHSKCRGRQQISGPYGIYMA